MLSDDLSRMRRARCSRSFHRSNKRPGAFVKAQQSPKATKRDHAHDYQRGAALPQVAFHASSGLVASRIRFTAALVIVRIRSPFSMP
jgi:hypothetical protein